MNDPLWVAVDEYLAGLFVGDDPAMAAALASCEAAGLPAHHVSPLQGKLLMVLALLCRAERVLEIGTLGGYSTIWLGRGVGPTGRVVTIEASEQHAAIARANLDAAGLSDVADVRVGPALDVLPVVALEAGKFDLVFIDADKENNPAYLAWALVMTRAGGLIVGDNVVREGSVLDSESDDARVRGVRTFNELLAGEPRVVATALQTVGSKGHDGFAVGVVVAEAGG